MNDDSLERDRAAIDQSMMARCIELSKTGAAAGEIPIGSLVARGGQVISEAINQSMRVLDESRHAEVLAIAQARQLLGDDELGGCTLYSTVEPCPMCSYCIRTAGIGRVVFALGSPRMGGLSRWNILGDDRFPLLFGPAPELVSGILADDAHQTWTELRPVIGRAVLWLGYLKKPPTKTRLNGRTPRFRFSLRLLISIFFQQRNASPEAAEGRGVSRASRRLPRDPEP